MRSFCSDWKLTRSWEILCSRRNENFTNLQTPRADAAAEENPFNSTQIRSSRRDRSNKGMMKALKMSIIHVLTFLLLWTPYTLIQTWYVLSIAEKSIYICILHHSEVNLWSWIKDRLLMNKICLLANQIILGRMSTRSPLRRLRFPVWSLIFSIWQQFSTVVSIPSFMASTSI